MEERDWGRGGESEVVGGVREGRGMEGGKRDGGREENEGGKRE